jgi:serine/threonine-protein kinase
MSNFADSNLLFGMIAWQMDFIDRDALFDAMQAWTFDKSKKLGDILIAHDKLTPERHALLDQLVQEHVKQHDDDAGKSLSALSEGSSARDLFDGIDDPEVQQSLRLASAAPSVDTYATQEAPPAESESGQRFRILRPHARGGLGQISVALDKELQREVALKELQMRHAANEATRERFTIEASITGSLEHPGVVPVYGLGHYSDGRPYYAMRFIRGDNLKEAIEQFHRISPDNQNLELRKLLRRFVDVCDAIQYAHSRGVLHRDLKPGNIMLGKYGETLVVDWGLAKPIDVSEAPTIVDGPPLQVSSGSGSAPTSMGSVIGTPSYMSPEQATGRLDLLGPASDVYSLGATLYHLLTGQAPFQDKSSEVLKKVERGDFKPPREVRQEVPQALEAICLKAMARRPEDRYQSTLRLAEEIERWLADEPVAAWPEPVSVQFGRWVRRHWTSVSSVAAAACVGLLLLGVSWILLKSAHDREQASHARARQVVDEYFTEVSESELLNQPGSQNLRRDLLQRAAAHYKRFAVEHALDPQVGSELANAHFRLGLIREALDSPEEALQEFDTAASRQRQLVGAMPEDGERLYALGKTLNARGRVLQEADRSNEATAALREALEIREQLVKLRPNDAEFARTLANSHMNLGEMLRFETEPAQALEQFEIARALYDATRQQAPDNPRLLRDSGKGYYNLANLELEQGQQAAAKQHFAAAIDAFEDVRRASPSDLEVLELLTLAHRRLADAKQAAQELEESAADYDRALQIAGVLSFQNPGVRSYQATYAGILMNLAGLHSQMQQPEQAAARYEQSREILVALVETHPQHEPYQVDLAASLANLGRIHLWLERPADAEQPLRDAARMMKPLAGEATAVRNRWIHGIALYQLGRSEWAAGQMSASADHLEAAAKVLSAAHEQAPGQSEYEVQVQEVEAELHALYMAAIRHSQSDALDRWKQRAEAAGIDVENFEDVDLGAQIAGRLRTIARLQWAAQRLDPALETMQFACELWGKLAPVASDSPELVRRRDVAFGDLGALLLDVGRNRESDAPEDARQSYTRARELLVPLVEQYPDDEYYRKDLQAAEDVLEKLSTESPDN